MIYLWRYDGSCCCRTTATTNKRSGAGDRCKQGATKETSAAPGVSIGDQSGGAGQVLAERHLARRLAQLGHGSRQFVAVLLGDVPAEDEQVVTAPVGNTCRVRGKRTTQRAQGADICALARLYRVHLVLVGAP